jgi:hypothetical protein
VGDGWVVFWWRVRRERRRERRRETKERRRERRRRGGERKREGEQCCVLGESGGRERRGTLKKRERTLEVTKALSNVLGNFQAQVPREGLRKLR